MLTLALVAGIRRAKQDRVAGRMEEQAFRNVGMQSEDADKWDYASGDDDVMVLIYDVNLQRDLYVMGNVVDTAILKEKPNRRKKPLTDVDLIEKDPRARVPLNLPEGLRGWRNKRWRTKRVAGR